MHRPGGSLFLVSILAIAATVLAACSASSPAPTAASSPETPTSNPFAGVPGIVEPANHGWPRVVEGLNGRVTIPAKPQRIITLSVGHDEISYGLVFASRIVAVGSSTKNVNSSNVASLAEGAAVISGDPEVILAQRPDIMVTSPYLKLEVVKVLTGAGLTVIQTGLADADVQARVNDILLLGYIYGEEERAVALAAEVRGRSQALRSIVDAKPAQSRLRVLAMARYYEKIYTAGRSSTSGNIIEAAGGINAAAQAGLNEYPAISIESIIAIWPEVIILTQPQESGEEFRRDLMTNPTLAEVPAIKNQRVFIVGSKYFTTLSFWNLRGAEELAKILWPSDFAGKEFGPFSFPR